MSNSKLASFFKQATHYSEGRIYNGKPVGIEKITIHHMAGVLTAEQCGSIFQGSRQASAHYGIGKDGKIGQYVDEADTAWADGNWNSNCRSVTIETSNCMTGGEWPVSALVLNKLVELVADIAKRNNLGKLVAGKNLTWHQMYAATACPGPYLLGKMEYIAAEANKLNSEPAPEPKPEPKPETPTEGYLVKVKADVLNIRENAGTEYKITGQIKDHGTYTIVAEKDGTGASKWGKLKSGAGWISLDYVERVTSGTAKQETATPSIRKGSKVMFTGTKSYSGIKLADWTNGSIFDVIEISGDRVVIGKGTAVTAAVNIRDCRPV